LINVGFVGGKGAIGQIIFREVSVSPTSYSPYAV